MFLVMQRLAALLDSNSGMGVSVAKGIAVDNPLQVDNYFRRGTSTGLSTWVFHNDARRLILANRVYCIVDYGCDILIT